jgi:predicted transcriptional regulator
MYTNRDARFFPGEFFEGSGLNPAVRENGVVLAQSKVLKRGRRVGVCEVEVTQAGKLIAKGIFTYLFFDR